MFYADWNYWKRIPQIDLWSAVKLSFGIDPRDEGSIPLAKRNPCKDSKIMPEDLFKERHELARSNLYHGLDASPPDSGQDYGFSKVRLPKFATWALLIELEIPKELAAMAGPRNVTQINDTLGNVDKPLATIERESLLKLVIGMAVKGYSYDPDAKKNTSVSDIAADLAVLGLQLDVDTIRKYLKQGAELLKP